MPSSAPASPSLRRRAIFAFLATTASAGLGALALSPWLATPIAGLVRAIAVPVALAVLAGPWLSEHGRDRLGPANALTLARAALIGACAAPTGDAHAEDLVWPLVFANGFAFVLDWVDGRVARTTGWASPFGARLDMELDAIAILVMCAQVWLLGRTGAWVLASGLLRYGFVGAGLAFPWMERPLFPAPRRAWICGVQVVCLIGALVAWPAPLDTPPGLAWGFAAFGLAALVGSFGIDTAWLVARRHEPMP